MRPAEVLRSSGHLKVQCEWKRCWREFQQSVPSFAGISVTSTASNNLTACKSPKDDPRGGVRHFSPRLSFPIPEQAPNKAVKRGPELMCDQESATRVLARGSDPIRRMLKLVSRTPEPAFNNVSSSCTTRECLERMIQSVGRNWQNYDRETGPPKRATDDWLGLSSEARPPQATRVQSVSRCSTPDRDWLDTLARPC
jgi:hypothetical protein